MKTHTIVLAVIIFTITIPHVIFGMTPQIGNRSVPVWVSALLLLYAIATLLIMVSQTTPKLPSKYITYNNKWLKSY